MDKSRQALPFATIIPYCFKNFKGFFENLPYFSYSAGIFALKNLRLYTQINKIKTDIEQMSVLFNKKYFKREF